MSRAPLGAQPRAPGGPAPASSAAAPSIVYHQPVCSGTIPVGRWGFASAAVGPRVFVFGGVGPSILDDLAVLDAELMIWRSLTPSAARARDRPDKLHAAAMCAVGNTLWMFGGQQGRKHLRTLYSLNTDVLDWRLVTPAGAQPAAREGHTLTAVASSGLAYLFGGQGKKLYNDLFILKPGGSAEWVELKPAGRAPTPRSGHSMLWDGGDRLVCFAGAAATTTDSALSVYSISRNEWSAVQAQGTAPSPRTRHSAVLLGPGTMLVFGGCNSSGVFFNDSYLLDLDSWTWTRLQPLSPPPPARYHHCCHVADGKVVLYGGVNPKQAFDSVVLLQTSSGVQELSALADELARMTGGSIPSPGAAAAAAAAAAGAGAAAGSSAAALLGAAAGAGPAGSSPLVGDLMKLQLRDLLVKRNMEELHVTAQQKAEAVEVKLQQEHAEKLALQKEVMQLQLVKEESEAAAKQLREQLADTSRALTRETAEHQATSAVLSNLRSNLESREQQLGDARQLLDSMSAELGILASRLHRLQQERDALRAARHQERAARRHALDHHHQQQQQQQASSSSSPPQQQLTSCQLQALQPLTGAAAAAAQLQMAAQAAGNSSSSSSGHGAGTAAAGGGGDPYTTDGSTVDSQSFVDCISDSLQQQQQQQPVPPVPALPPLQLQLGQQADTLVPVSSLQHFNSISSAAGNSRGSSPAGLESDSGLLASGEQADASVDEPMRLCIHGQLDGACLLCMCQRFLEATAGSCTHWMPGSSLSSAAARLSSSGNCLASPGAAAAAADGDAAGPSSSSSRGALASAAGAAGQPSAATLATAAVAACATEAAQYKQYLSISELARNRLEAEHATLQQQVQDLQAQVQQQQQQIHAMQAQPAALTACSMEELTSLEATLEASTKAVRQVVMQRSIAEYQRQASADTLRCAVCMEARRSLAFACGHQTCDDCGSQMTACPFCRQTITAKIRLFE